MEIIELKIKELKMKFYTNENFPNLVKDINLQSKSQTG